ncbi:DUF1667 domain-containing protein [Candidatus Margulisiibacteriota bacterium]
MEIRKMTCIECPQGCQLSVDIDKGYVIKVTGHKCPKGETYAKQEVEAPMRTLISTVVARGLEIKMVPVKTNKEIPKEKLLEGIREIREQVIKKPIKMGEIIIPRFLGLDCDLVATRSVK